MYAKAGKAPPTIFRQMDITEQANTKISFKIDLSWRSMAKTRQQFGQLS